MPSRRLCHFHRQSIPAICCPPHVIELLPVTTRNGVEAEEVQLAEVRETHDLIVALSAALMVAVSASAFAQTTEFYVVQDAQTKRCTIVDKRPTVTTTTVVGNGVFKTRAEAETGMKTIKVCTTN